MGKIDKDAYKLSQDMLDGASEYVKRKMFRKNSPIVIVENDKLYLLDKDKNKKEIKAVKKKVR